LDHGEEVGGDLVVAGSDAAEVLQLEKKRSIKLRSAIEALAEARLRALVSLRRDFGRGALVLDQRPEAIGIVGLVCQRDGAWAKVVGQRVGDLPVMRLPAVRPSRTGRPCASTTTWILVVSPPRDRPRQ
jgi:hypothetical protein